MHTLVAVYFVTLFYAFHYALPLYSESTFLESLIPETFVGLVYSVSACVSVLLTLNIKKVLNRLSNRSVLIVSAIAEALLLLGIVFSPYTWLTLILFVLKSVVLSVLFVSLNILIESVSTNKNTGKIRGMYLTILNLGILTGPFFAGFIVGYGLNLLFFVSALCLIPMAYILIRHLDHLKEPPYSAPNLQAGFAFVRARPDVQRIVFAQYVLELFYIIMIVYGPLYLIQSNILDLKTYLGIVIPIVLIPFILIPYPLGKIADKKLGEKELLICGTLLMIFGTTLFALLDSTVLLYFVFALFVARLGASMVEEMASSYFYKKVDDTQANVISIFVNTRNIALITGPLIGSLIIGFFPSDSLMAFQVVFLVLAGILALSLIPSLKIHDTK